MIFITDPVLMASPEVLTNMGLSFVGWGVTKDLQPMPILGAPVPDDAQFVAQCSPFMLQKDTFMPYWAPSNEYVMVQLWRHHDITSYAAGARAAARIRDLYPQEHGPRTGNIDAIDSAIAVTYLGHTAREALDSLVQGVLMRSPDEMVNNTRERFHPGELTRAAGRVFSHGTFIHRGFYETLSNMTGQPFTNMVAELHQHARYESHSLLVPSVLRDVHIARILRVPPGFTYPSSHSRTVTAANYVSFPALIRPAEQGRLKYTVQFDPVNAGLVNVGDVFDAAGIDLDEESPNDYLTVDDLPSAVTRDQVWRYCSQVHNNLLFQPTLYS